MSLNPQPVAERCFCGVGSELRLVRLPHPAGYWNPRPTRLLSTVHCPPSTAYRVNAQRSSMPGVWLFPAHFEAVRKGFLSATEGEAPTERRKAKRPRKNKIRNKRQVVHPSVAPWASVAPLPCAFRVPCPVRTFSSGLESGSTSRPLHTQNRQSVTLYTIKPLYCLSLLMHRETSTLSIIK